MSAAPQVSDVVYVNAASIDNDRIVVDVREGNNVQYMIISRRAVRLLRETLASFDTAPIAPAYDPDDDNCAGGCRRDDNRRVAFSWHHMPAFACPGCFEA